MVSKRALREVAFTVAIGLPVVLAPAIYRSCSARDLKKDDVPLHQKAQVAPPTLNEDFCRALTQDDQKDNKKDKPVDLPPAHNEQKSAPVPQP